MVNPKVNIVTAETVIEGRMTILAIVRGGTCLAIEYIQNLQDPPRKKVLALLSKTAQDGRPPPNREKFDKLAGPLLEFKSYQDRLPCFYDGPARIVITHGFQKKKNRTPKEQIERALRLRAEYQESEQPQRERKK
jgi:phage-related protein